jgi:hypothetical protein
MFTLNRRAGHKRFKENLPALVIINNNTSACTGLTLLSGADPKYDF